ncbi:variable surface protein [Plasmodium gonderi]|uniref:Variable surface protein n=1 Tax=Plasmodium gonderi TaxID=77519 RepID=A0A1Y1J8M8_PLAGO|nr:variable surface protein [Plasmodium gonderi]GAW78859.1 variable surface protein [Plasmodium gonderi]
MDALSKNEWDDIFKILSINDIYKKFDDKVDIHKYNDNCESVTNKNGDIKELCKLFLKNINNLSSIGNGIKKDKFEESYLAYWLIDELSKHFTNNKDDDTRNIIVKIISLGNNEYKNLNKKHFFFNSDFDFDWSKEEKHLNEYFKNFDKILKCAEDKYDTCVKYLNYISTIYEKHRNYCMWGDCHYFSYNPKRNPNYILSTLNHNYKKSGEVENKEVQNEESGISINSNTREQKMDMLIKYLSCTEVYDQNGDIFAYKCEDPAYRRHNEKVYNRRSIKKKIVSKEPINNILTSDAIKEIKDLNCNMVQNSNILVCNNKKNIGSRETPLTNASGKALESITNTGYVVHHYGSTTNDSHTKSSITENAKAYPIIRDHEDTDNIYPGVTLLPANRKISEFRESDHKYEEHIDFGNKHSTLLTSVFHEFKNENLKGYFEDIVRDVSVSTTDRSNYSYINRLEVQTSGIHTQLDSVISNNGYGFTNMGITTSFETKSNIFSNTIFRIFVITVLVTGIFFVLFIYFKFTPFGTWIRRCILREKRMNNNIYKKHIKKHPNRISHTKNINQKRKRVQIAYNS